MNELWRCRRCGEVIGVYEPAVRLVDGRAHATSRALEPGAAHGDGERFHRACYERVEDRAVSAG